MNKVDYSQSDSQYSSPLIFIIWLNFRNWLGLRVFKNPTSLKNIMDICDICQLKWIPIRKKFDWSDCTIFTVSTKSNGGWAVRSGLVIGTGSSTFNVVDKSGWSVLQFLFPKDEFYRLPLLWWKTSFPRYVHHGIVLLSDDQDLCQPISPTSGLPTGIIVSD